MNGAKRDAAYEFIQTEVLAGRPFPDRKAICRHVGWETTPTAKVALDDMEAEGLIERVKAPDEPRGGKSGVRPTFYALVVRA